MSKQRTTQQDRLDNLDSFSDATNVESDSAVQQTQPWYQACRANVVPALSTLAVTALINLPDFLPLVYGSGGGDGSRGGH